MAEILGSAVNGVINLVDVDGVVRKVDVDDAIQRIDMNELLDKVDMNRLIDRVDLNRQLDRIDLDRALRRVDVNALVLRSDVGAILTHSTSGIFTEILDTVRSSVVQADTWIYNVMGFILRRDLNLLPPAPGELPHRRKKPASSGMALSTSVQGCCCGVVSKGLAIFLDSLIVTFSFAVLLIIIEAGWKVLTKGDDKLEIDRDGRYALVAYGGYWFVYFWFWTVAAQRTIGMAIVGLKVVRNHDGENIGVTQGWLRTALLPLSAMVAVVLVVVGLLRQDGRMLHDFVAGTSLIYKWNAAMAKFRSHHAELQQQQHQVDGSSMTLDERASLHVDSSYNSTSYLSLSEQARLT